MNRSLVTLVALVAGASLAKGPVAVFLPRALNLDAAQAAAIGEVCATRYATVSQQDLIGPAQAAAAVGPNGSVVEAARALQASELVEFTLVSLADKRGHGRLMVNAVRRSVDGTELFRADVTADSSDDVVAACERLAIALTNRVPVETTANRHNITAAEARATRNPNRVGSEKIFGLKTTFTAPLASGQRLNPQGGLAFDVRLEQERYFLELGLGFFIPTSGPTDSTGYGGIHTELGASYYLMDSDIAPYLGAGLQPRVVFSGSIINLAPYAQAGLMFWRQSSTRLYVDARVSQNVLPVGYSHQSWPTELSVQAGVGF